MSRTTMWHVLGVTGALCAEFFSPTILLGGGVDIIGCTVQGLKHLGGFVRCCLWKEQSSVGNIV